MVNRDVRAHPPLVMCFSATDPTGGAGMQADLMTLSALGCHPLGVVTAVTVQDTTGVEEIVPMDDDLVVDQARVLLSDVPVAAFKIGVMGSVENIAAIAEIISDYPHLPVVFDPVLSSGRGDELADEEMVIALQELLLPLTTVLTPNSLEARRLAQFGDDEDDEDGDDDPDSRQDPPALDECARLLIAAGCGHVLLTGTHESTLRVSNVLYGHGGVIRRDEWDRLPGSYHGSGCTLASAVAAWLAQGLDVGAAVQAAQEYTWRTLVNGFRPGMGQYLPDRFFWTRNSNMDADDGSDDQTMAADRRPLRGLYAVTPETLSGAALYRAAEAACAGGAVLLQYRNKSCDVACRLADALALRAITTVCGTRFIVNDDVELAHEVGADGVHVGRDDGDPGAARRRLGPAALIGVSCYNDAGLAREARRAGADYVAFGAMFASTTKPAAPVADPARFAEVADLDIARCAIGGITLARAPALIEAGADLLAVVSDLFDATDISARARAYAQLF